MKDIQAIARYMRLPEEQLKFPIELLNQGYEPNYLANYRPDELGNIDEQTLSVLRRALKYSEALKLHKEKVQATLERELQWNETVSSVIAECNTISQVDTVIRHLRTRRNSKSIADKCPQVEAIGQAILTLQGEPPKDLAAWVAEQTQVSLEQATDVLEQTKRWLVHLLSEDVKLMHELQRAILKKASISVKVLPDPPKGSAAEKQLEQSEDNPNSAHEATVQDGPPKENPPDVSTPSITAVNLPSESEVTLDEASHPAPASTEETASSNASASESGTDSIDSASTTDLSVSTEAVSESPSNLAPLTAAVAPLIAEFHQGRKQSKGIKTKTLSDKQLSPRQRRRKWLRSILETYAKLKKPIAALTPYQILMLSRGQRSQIISVQFHYDEKPLVQACRESLCPGRHPMHHWLMEIAEEGLRSHILPRLHQDVFSILEEDAHTDLTEAAVLHLQSSLLQRPVRGHRIMVIDAIGPKMAAVVVVDQDGNVIFTNEIACNSNRPDVVAQNVVSLGQWIHEHKVTLLALSNGPARRYLIHTVSELLKQSAEGSLYWTMVDRAGADSYCMSRGCLIELPKISRRHRAATWLAWRLQDPLKQILKVEPARLRLGSYQRELPQRELEHALQDAVSAAITQAGVDVFHASVEVLKRIPGMNTEASKAVVQACQEDRIQNRETLMSVLREHLSEMQARQAIGFLKVYGSSNTLDGTTIHPDDYRLAERLVAHAKLPLPAASPENWSKPDYARLAAASAQATIEHANQSNEPAEVMDPDAVHDEHAEAVAGDFAAELLSEATEPDEQTPAPESESTSETPTADAESLTSAAVTESDTSESASIESAAADSVTNESNASDSSEDTAEQDGESTAIATEGSTNTLPRSGAVMPPIPTGPMERPVLAIDAEKLARSWQVGREKLKRVANCLQFSFMDTRDFQYPNPLQSRVPRLDQLKPGMMLQALVIGVADFGVFADLGPECSGLIHISRLAPEFIEDPHQFVQVGDLVPVWVLNVDSKKKRVSLTAIPPGTPTRRQESAGADSRTQERGQSERDSQSRDRNPRGERNTAGGRDGGQRGTRPQGTADAAGVGARRPSDGARDGRRGNDSRNPRGGKSFGRGNPRDRNRQENDAQESAPRRPVRVEPAKPITPISDAMQQGKEPLRSFSDLMQFMKKTRDEPSVENNLSPKSVEYVPSEPSVPASQVERVAETEMPVEQGESTPPQA
jgi:transcriptional accessory protein Tex/SPT6